MTYVFNIPTPHDIPNQSLCFFPDPLPDNTIYNATHVNCVCVRVHVHLYGITAVFVSVVGTVAVVVCVWLVFV